MSTKSSIAYEPTTAWNKGVPPTCQPFHLYFDLADNCFYHTDDELEYYLELEADPEKPIYFEASPGRAMLRIDRVTFERIAMAVLESIHGKGSVTITAFEGTPS